MDDNPGLLRMPLFLTMLLQGGEKRQFDIWYVIPNLFFRHGR